MLSSVTKQKLKNVSQIRQVMRMSTSSDFYPTRAEQDPVEGPNSRNPLAFKHYDAEEKVLGKTERAFEIQCCVLAHVSVGGHDPFGVDPTIERPWDDGSGVNALRQSTLRSEFFSKLDVDYYAFHDVDASQEGPHSRKLKFLILSRIIS